MAGASISDLEEIAEGRASSDDKQEAGEPSVKEARDMLRSRHALKVHTTTRTRPMTRKVAKKKR